MINIRNQMAPLVPPGRNAKKSCTSFSPCRPAEGQREHLRAHQDEHHHRGDASGGVGRIAENGPRHPPTDGRDDNGSKRAHGSRLGRRGYAGDDRAEHGAYQSNGRKYYSQQFSREFGRRDEVTFVLRHCRDHLRTKETEAKQINDIDAGKHQAWDHRGREQCRPTRSEYPRAGLG